jgi:signal transduction histidine kinase
LALTRRTKRWIAIPWVTDVLVVLVMAILAVAERFSQTGTMHRPIDVVLAAVVLAALVFRRAAPLGALAVIASVIFVQNAFLGADTSTADRAVFVAVFTVAALRGPRWAIVAVIAPAVAYVPYLRYPDTSCGVPCQFGWTTLFIFAAIAGVAVREGRQRNKELRAQTEMLRRTRHERVIRAVHEERARIARDVHDMVAHGLTLMVIQAGAARWLAESDPLKADRALRSVEAAGQEAIHELHSLVGSLGPSSPNGAEALPVDEQLTIRSLIDEAVDTGMNVELVIDGQPHPLNAGLENSLYRIVQEALTNVRKHAPGARVSVQLSYTPQAVELQVTDVGGRSAGGPEPLPGSGQGLVGIAERAALFGGHAEAAPTSEGGFRVHASLAEERVLV